MENKYKYLSIVLAIIAIVFAVLYFTKPEPSVGDIYQGISTDVQKCSDKVAEWKNTYGTQASSTEKQAALDEILKDCKDMLAVTQEKL